MTIVTAYLECLNHLPMPTFTNYNFTVFQTPENVNNSYGFEPELNKSHLIASIERQSTTIKHISCAVLLAIRVENDHPKYQSQSIWLRHERKSPKLTIRFWREQKREHTNTHKKCAENSVVIMDSVTFCHSIIC